MEYIAFDSHKRYTLASVQKQSGGQLCEARVEHERSSIKQFLSRWEPGSPVAVETIGNWYWIVDEIEEAGMVPQLVHARKAKLMLAMVNKTDKLDGVPRRPPFLWVRDPPWQLPVQPCSEECMERGNPGP
jgi:hypothetical protein